MLDIKFPYEKITQALNYLAAKNGGKINKMKAIKLIYFADRYHLRKYAELLSEDKYFGMKYGPVPSLTKDLTTKDLYLDDDVKKYVEKYLDTKKEYNLKTKNEVDNSYISDSEKEALDFAFKKFGDKNHFELAEISHHYPEWKNIESKLNEEKRVELNIKDFINDPDENFDPCFELSEEDKKDLLEELREKENIDKIIN